MSALQEVEDALDRERNQIDLLDEIALQLNIAGQQLQAARTSYTDGVAEYLDVITAVQTQQSLQRQQVTAKKQLLVYRASLYRSLGGTWMRSLEPPPVDATLEKQVAMKLPQESAQ